MSKKRVLPMWVETQQYVPNKEVYEFIMRLNAEFLAWGWRPQRVYFSRKGCHRKWNDPIPFRYNERGFLAAKEYFRREKVEEEAPLLPTAPKELIDEAYNLMEQLGWGCGTGGRWMELTIGKGMVRFRNHGRWFLSDEKSIKDLIRRAKKAQLMMSYFRKYLSFQVPEEMKDFFVDPMKKVTIDEQASEVVLYISSMRNERFSTAPLQMQRAKARAVRLAREHAQAYTQEYFC